MTGTKIEIQNRGLKVVDSGTDVEFLVVDFSLREKFIVVNSLALALALQFYHGIVCKRTVHIVAAYKGATYMLISRNILHFVYIGLLQATHLNDRFSATVDGFRTSSVDDDELSRTCTSPAGAEPINCHSIVVLLIVWE